MLNIDEDYLKLLSKLMNTIEGPTDMAVAGGAIRDMLFDKEVKDIADGWKSYYLGPLKDLLEKQ